MAEGPQGGHLKLPEQDQQGYDEVRRLAVDPELAPLNYPEAIEGRKSETTWKRHLYVGEGNVYPATLNSWETKVLKAELQGFRDLSRGSEPDPETLAALRSV